MVANKVIIHPGHIDWMHRDVALAQELIDTLKERLTAWAGVVDGTESPPAFLTKFFNYDTEQFAGRALYFNRATNFPDTIATYKAMPWSTLTSIQIANPPSRPNTAGRLQSARPPQRLFTSKPPNEKLYGLTSHKPLGGAGDARRTMATLKFKSAISAFEELFNDWNNFWLASNTHARNLYTKVIDAGLDSSHLAVFCDAAVAATPHLNVSAGLGILNGQRRFNIQIEMPTLKRWKTDYFCAAEPQQAMFTTGPGGAGRNNLRMSMAHLLKLAALENCDNIYVG